VFGAIGIAGVAISVVAYVPQVVHLARERCSAGVSNRAWTLWLFSSVLVGAVAVQRRDPVFILLQICSFISASLILLLARRYRDMRCESHVLPIPEGGPPSSVGTGAISSP
jgi:lipid-A-disaccharide synthase-like uncharacterized protein